MAFVFASEAKNIILKRNSSAIYYLTKRQLFGLFPIEI